MSTAKYTVNQLAKIAGVSVRTLHHYDAIGLLKPADRSHVNYRFYGHDELLRLQQILLYRELDFSLEKIAEILDDPGFDLLNALKEHKAELKQRQKRMDVLLKTIDTTMNELKKRNQQMDYNEMYKGFEPGKAEAWEKEAREKYGDKAVDDSHKKIMAMNKQEWADLNHERDQINHDLVKAMHLPVSDAAVQAIVKRHHDLTAKFMNLTLDIYRGLGHMYVDDERFKSNYDKYKEGLAEFLRAGIIVFCDKNG